MKDQQPIFTWRDGGQQILDLFDASISPRDIVTKILHDTGTNHDQVLQRVKSFDIDHIYKTLLSWALLADQIEVDLDNNQPIQNIISKYLGDDPLDTINTLTDYDLKHHYVMMLIAEMLMQKKITLENIQLKTKIAGDDIVQYLEQKADADHNWAPVFMVNKIIYSIQKGTFRDVFLEIQQPNRLGSYIKRKGFNKLIDLLVKSGLDEDSKNKMHGELVMQLLDDNNEKEVLATFNLNNSNIDAFVHRMQDAMVPEVYIDELKRLTKKPNFVNQFKGTPFEKPLRNPLGKPLNRFDMSPYELPEYQRFKPKYGAADAPARNVLPQKNIAVGKKDADYPARNYQRFKPKYGAADYGAADAPARNVLSQKNIAVGKKDADYDFVRSLGSGFFGEVWLAHLKGTNENVAIKKFGQQTPAANMAAYTLEIERLKELGTCSIYTINYIGSYIDNNRPRIIMEYVEGTDLSTYMFGIPLKNRQTRHDVTITLINGLDCLHRIDIAHQDIKESNIQWDTKNNIPRYLDWGLACIRRTCCGEPCGRSGTLYTTPPELKNYYHWDRAKDIYNINEAKAHDMWSIGVVILNWYTQYYKYWGDSNNHFHNKTQQQLYNMISGVDNNVVRKILQHLLNRSSDRYKNWVDVMRLNRLLQTQSQGYQGADGKQVAQMSKGHSNPSSVNFDAVVKSKQDLKNFSKKDLRSLAKYYSLPLSSPKDEIYWMLALNITKDHGL